MSLFYETLTKKENLAFKARKKAFKKGKPSRSTAFGSVIIKLDKGWSLEPIDISGIN